ncbi:MAG: hypothetical protein MMC33_004788 [Icmadophila ericetorum]|nr:hypothetical protein [Icmadophila ericetorum]
MGLAAAIAQGKIEAFPWMVNVAITNILKGQDTERDAEKLKQMMEGEKEEEAQKNEEKEKEKEEKEKENEKKEKGEKEEKEKKKGEKKRDVSMNVDEDILPILSLPTLALPGEDFPPAPAPPVIAYLFDNTAFPDPLLQPISQMGLHKPSNPYQTAGEVFPVFFAVVGLWVVILGVVAFCWCVARRLKALGKRQVRAREDVEMLLGNAAGEKGGRLAVIDEEEGGDVDRGCSRFEVWPL